MYPVIVIGGPKNRGRPRAGCCSGVYNSKSIENGRKLKIQGMLSMGVLTYPVFFVFLNSQYFLSSEVLKFAVPRAAAGERDPHVVALD